MATNYPASADTFDVPASPSTTPLSSAGTGTRNHVTHHRDLGDAVMALQNNVTKTNHTHSGTGLNGPKLVQAYTHEEADTDSSNTALHHTIGSGAFQAASGAHNHDTRYVRLDGAVDQSITGKKTFPTGADAIAIPDFTNSAHNHSTAARGGIAAVAGGVYPNKYYAATDGTSNIPGNVTRDFYLHTNRFTLPANCALSGYVSLSYRVSTSLISDVFTYISYNQGGSPAFDTDKNLLIAGGAFNGRMTQNVIYHNERATLTMPIYLEATNADRSNMAIIMRILNNSNTIMQEVNTGLQVHFLSNIITL